VTHSALPPLHPACAVLPQLPDNELRALADDIAENGLRDEIVLDKEGRILDGRNRWLACVMADVPVRTMTYEGTDPVRYVISKNERRRHLSDTVRALIAGQLANMIRGTNAKNIRRSADVDDEPPITAAEAAKMMGVTERVVDDTRVIIQRASPNVIDMVKDKKVGIRTAVKAARFAPKETQLGWTVNDVRRAGRDSRADRSPTVAGPNGEDDVNEWPTCIPKELEEAKLNKNQLRTIASIRRYFTDRRSQRILTFSLEQMWPHTNDAVKRTKNIALLQDSLLEARARIRGLNEELKKSNGDTYDFQASQQRSANDE
jgi:hypothetical protein